MHFYSLKKFHWIFLPLVFIVVVLACVYFYSESAPSNDLKTQGEVWALDEVGDPNFKEYMLDVLWPQCPFYQPSGALYRECLQTAAAKARTAYESEDMQEIEHYCEALGARFEGLLGGEMTIACQAYRFSQKPL